MTLAFDTLNCRSTDVLCRKKVDLTGTHTWRSSPLRTAVCYCPISSPDEPPRQARVTHYGCVCQSLRSWLCSVETSASCYLFPFLQQREQSVMINRLGSYRSRGKKDRGWCHCSRFHFPKLSQAESDLSEDKQRQDQVVWALGSWWHLAKMGYCFVHSWEAACSPLRQKFVKSEGRTCSPSYPALLSGVWAAWQAWILGFPFFRLSTQALLLKTSSVPRVCDFKMEDYSNCTHPL